ncbi:MAG: hypothetical protein ACLU3U_07460 [Gallintestinimicrobium sp.]
MNIWVYDNPYSSRLSEAVQLMKKVSGICGGIQLVHDVGGISGVS